VPPQLIVDIDGNELSKDLHEEQWLHADFTRQPFDPTLLWGEGQKHGLRMAVAMQSMPARRRENVGMKERTMDATPHDHGGNRPPVRDVLEFYLRWKEFRPDALAAMNGLCDTRKEVLGWLIALADRVGDADMHSPRR
jgi:hypothetical protein